MLPRMTDRPQYDPAFIETARTLAARGAMDHDIAVALGIARPSAESAAMP